MSPPKSLLRNSPILLPPRLTQKSLVPVKSSGSEEDYQAHLERTFHIAVFGDQANYPIDRTLRERLRMLVPQMRYLSQRLKDFLMKVADGQEVTSHDIRMHGGDWSWLLTEEEMEVEE